jgi:hypothetical protein
MNLNEAVRYTDSIRKLQYKAGKVSAIDFKYLIKEKQLYINSQARSSDGSRIYKASIVFKGLPAKKDMEDTFILPYSSKGHGVDFYIKQPTSSTEVMLRCQCPDYYFMWEFWNKQRKALLGPHKKYVRLTPPPPDGRPFVNPSEAPGCCKHLLAMIKMLTENKILYRDPFIMEYLNRPLRQQL